jgi:hypothetical protein
MAAFMGERPAVVPAVIVGICLVLGLSIGGWFVGRGATRFRSDSRVVTVKGLVEREVKADQAVWTLGLRRASESLPDAHTRISADRDAAVPSSRSRASRTPRSSGSRRARWTSSPASTASRRRLTGSATW